MRLLQLRLDGDPGALDFHPMVTVVTGLDAGARVRLVDAIGQLARGEYPGLPGLIEAHGVLFDLAPESLAMLSMEGTLDPIVRRADLPGPGVEEGDVEPQGPPVAALTAEQFLATVADGVHPDLDAARRRQRQARETLSILREAAERARTDHADAAAALRRARGAFERVSNAGSRASLDEASALLDDFVFDQPKVRERPELEAAIEDLTTRLSHVEQGLQELSALDTRPIEVLLDAIRNPSEGEMVPSERANQLADEFVALQGQVEALEDSLGAGGGGQTSALNALETARTELAAAARAMQKPDLSPDDIAELEAAHEATMEAEGKSGGRLRRGASSKRFDEAQAAEQVILDRVGFPTWSSYVMGAHLLGIDPLAEERLEQARFQVESAEAHWAQVAAAIEANPEHRALLDRLEAVYLEAFDLLGGDDEHADVEAALRAVRVPKAEVSQDELVDALAYQLELVGLDLGTRPGVDLVLLAADAFLTEVSAVSQRLGELGAERDELQVELADARHELEQVSAAEVAAAEREAGPTIDLTDSATTADDAGPSLEQLEVEVEEAESAEHDMAEALEARLALLDATTQVEAVASSRVMRIATQLAAETEASGAGADAMMRPASDPAFDVEPDDDASGAESIEFYLLARLAQQRAVSYSGSAPMLFDDAFSGLDRDVVWSLLDKLERMSESVQLIVVSDDAVVADWAGAAGIQRAAVVSPTTQFA